MTMIRLEECREVDEFLDTIASPETKVTYTYLRKEFEKAGGKYNENTIMRYLQAMKDHNYSYSSVNNARSAIRKYCESNGIRLNWERISKVMGRKSYANKKLRAYTHEEIKKMLDVADPKMRAVILLLASTGMRRRGLTGLKWSDMEYLPDEKLYKITVYPGAEEEYTTFTTPEAAEAINKVRDGGSEYFHNIKPQLLSDDMRYLQIKAGIAERQHNVRQGQYRNEIPAIHGFRKFAITEMKRAGVDEETAKMMTDHTPQVGVRVRYLNFDWTTDLLPEYKKAISRLTFSQDKVDLMEIKDKEIAKLREQVQTLTQAMYDAGLMKKE